MQIELKNDEKKVKTIIDYYILTNKLKDLVRTGWKRWGVKRERVESVAEHIYGTCMLAVAIWSETLPEVNISEVILMLALHETEENIISDITPYDSEEKQKLKQSGEKAVKAIFKNLVAKDVYFKLVHDFDTLATPEAIFARKCDKLESDLQARLYSDEGVLLYENADEIKNHEQIVEWHNQGITDVADYFVLADRHNYEDGDIFFKISKYIEGKKIIKSKKGK
ncbi:MAG: HD domain-containing protein [Clostridia bacterium]|nr:HD domain-containing protein [Clostridia bacterium]